MTKSLINKFYLKHYLFIFICKWKKVLTIHNIMTSTIVWVDGVIRWLKIMTKIKLNTNKLLPTMHPTLKIDWFVASLVDQSLFIFHSEHSLLMLLLYIDDILLTGSIEALVSNFIQLLSGEFTMKDLRSIYQFLGIEDSKTITSLILDILCTNYT
jgi:hypothetical protein